MPYANGVYVLADDEKRCSRCLEPLPATAEFFHRSKRTRDGLNTRCKVCCVETPYYRRRARAREVSVNAVAEFAPSIYTHVPYAEYRASPGLNMSTLKEMAHSPKRFRWRLNNPLKSRALALGDAAHVAVLEPDRMTDFAVWDRRSEKTGKLCPRDGGHWEAFVAKHAGREIITESEYHEALAIQQEVRANKDAMRFLDVGEPEVSMQWTIRGRPCKGRADWLKPDRDSAMLVGLKTSRDPRLYQFSNQIARTLNYHLQWAWYHDGFEFVTGKPPTKVIEIVVENTPPYDVIVYEIPDEVIQQGRDDYMRLLERLEECEKANDWPGAAPGVVLFSLPEWRYSDEISGLELEP